MCRGPRQGYTLLEVLVVLALLVIIGMIIMPSISGLSGNTRVEAGADQVRGRLADARSLAIEQSMPYRVSINPTSNRIRVAPLVPMTGSNSEGGTGPVTIEEPLSEGVTARVLPSGEQPVQEVDGWQTVATYLQDGTCQEIHSLVEISEPGSRPMQVQVRGLTGGVDILSGGGGSP